MTRSVWRQVRLPVGPGSATVPLWVAKWQSLVVSHHLLPNRCQDQKTPSIFAELLVEGFEGSPGQGSVECFEIILLWQELGAPGSLWWHHVCCAMAKRIWLSTYKRKYKSFWYKDCICFKARSKRITPFFWSESVTLLLGMFAVVLGAV